MRSPSRGEAVRRAGIGEWLGAIILWAFAVGLGALSVWAAVEDQVPPTIAFGVMAILCGAGGLVLLRPSRGGARQGSANRPEAPPPWAMRLAERLRARGRHAP